MVLAHEGAAFVISNPLRDVLDPFNSTGDALKVHVSSTQLRVFSSFLDEILNFSFCISYLLGVHWGYSENLIFFLLKYK